MRIANQRRGNARKGNAVDRAALCASHKAARRLIPFLILCFLVAYLDRVNVGFAALTMNKELGLTAEMYGFVAGIFFRLLHIRGAIQFDPGKSWRTAVDCQDNDLLGGDFRIICFCGLNICKSPRSRFYVF
jgi:hypothetical protein